MNFRKHKIYSNLGSLKIYQASERNMVNANFLVKKLDK